MVKRVIFQRHRQPDEWNIRERSKTDLSICIYYTLVDSPIKGEKIDHSINGTGKLANNEEQKLDIFLLPHILSFDLISYLKGIKNMLRKAYESIKEI